MIVDAVTALGLAAARGDTAALAEFIRATQRDVRRCLVHLCDRDEVEDLAQETYLRALPSLPRFEGRSSARSWLLSIARRVAADHVRRASVRPRTESVDDLDRHRGATAGVDREVVLRRLVAGLTPDRREAFVLTQLIGLSYAEAAEACGCPVGTIRSRVARAREDLVAHLDAADRGVG